MTDPSDPTPELDPGDDIFDLDTVPLFVDPDPPDAPAEVWERSLARALDPAAEPHDDLVPDTQLEGADGDDRVTGADAANDDSASEESDGVDDPFQRPDEMSDPDGLYSGPDTTTAPDFDTDPW